MNDDKMDELLIQSVRDYNEPGTVPRDEIWARIEAERHGPARHGSGGSGSPVPRRWRWAVGGLAAALVLAVGIVIGRRVERASTPSSPAVARTPDTATNPPRDSALPQPQRVAEAPQQDSALNLAYRLVVLKHLAGSEAMITAFRSSARRGEVDEQIGDWSRDLLGTTRMLEASPVREDPSMKRLLEDLDLVIAQIAQYTTNGKYNPDDLDLIEQSIHKRGVITKLRSTLPARTLPAGS
ncbi:MAG: hypothetical protein ACREPM_25015 [Gemmatimonadaceae bacterium]